MTAPNFRPFERKHKRTKHLGPAKFLRSEEGDEWNEGSESEGSESEGNESERESGSDDETYSEPETPVSKKRKRESSTETIYIDQVMERTSQ